MSGDYSHLPTPSQQTWGPSNEEAIQREENSQDYSRVALQFDFSAHAPTELPRTLKQVNVSLNKASNPRVSSAAAELSPKLANQKQFLNSVARNNKECEDNSLKSSAVLIAFETECRTDPNAIIQDLKEFNERKTARDPNYVPLTIDDLNTLSNFPQKLEGQLSSFNRFNTARSMDEQIGHLHSVYSTGFSPSSLKPNSMIRDKAAEFLKDRPAIKKMCALHNFPPLKELFNTPRTFFESHLNSIKYLEEITNNKFTRANYKDTSNSLKTMLEQDKQSIEENKWTEDDFETELSSFSLEETDPSNEEFAELLEDVSLLTPEQGAVIHKETLNVSDAVATIKKEGLSKSTWNKFYSGVKNLFTSSKEFKFAVPEQTRNTIADGYLENLKNLGHKKVGEGGGFFGLLRMKLLHGLTESKREAFKSSVEQQVHFIVNTRGALDEDEFKIVSEALSNKDYILGNKSLFNKIFK
ncbi:MAG: hypothetical protein WC222_02145 [Parachlamydiales bacterium]|jgi:hypothetical protein